MNKIVYIRRDGAFNGPNGMPYGPGFGVQTKDFSTFSPVYANYQGGFFNTQPVNFESNLQKSVANAEQGARSEYFGQKAFETAYNSIIETYNVLFTNGYVYGESNNSINSNFGNYVDGVAAVGSVVKLKDATSVLKFGLGKALSTPASLYTLYDSYDKISSGKANPINCVDGFVSLGGLTLDAIGYENPVVDAGLAVYGMGKFSYDIYNSYNSAKSNNYQSVGSYQDLGGPSSWNH
ncbi:MAG: hypothetical protein Q8904_10880 [Bacteroidota bacterium]|nr:hypothetical protein [Bacteroidota bacterium]